MFEGFGNRRPLVNRARIVHRDEDEWCLQVGRCGQNGRRIIRSRHLLGLDKCFSKPRNTKGEWKYLSRRSIYRFCVVNRNDGSGSDLRYQWSGDLFINRRRGLLLVDNGGFVLDKFLGFGGDLDTTLYGRLRGGSRYFLLFLYRGGSKNRGDLGFLYSRGFVTGRDNLLRFRRGIIDIVNVSSPIGLGRGVVDSGPPAVDDELVQDLFLPGNANGSGEPGRTLVETNGTRPLFGRKNFRGLKNGTGSEAEPLRAYLIKGSGDDDLVGVVWPEERKTNR